MRTTLDSLDLGKLILDQLDEQEKSIYWLSKETGMNISNLCKILYDNNVDLRLLAIAMEKLNYDFFTHCSKHIMMKNNNNK